MREQSCSNIRLSVNRIGATVSTGCSKSTASSSGSENVSKRSTLSRESRAISHSTPASGPRRSSAVCRGRRSKSPNVDSPQSWSWRHSNPDTPSSSKRNSSTNTSAASTTRTGCALRAAHNASPGLSATPSFASMPSFTRNRRSVSSPHSVQYSTPTPTPAPTPRKSSIQRSFACFSTRGESVSTNRNSRCPILASATSEAKSNTNCAHRAIACVATIPALTPCASALALTSSKTPWVELPSTTATNCDFSAGASKSAACSRNRGTISAA